ncbi:DUF4435 domain-containing protein [Pseudomonas syringae]|uniref:DUF4435 domain-containing protein n=1 Tax=Pseudomonas syringae TaxID=317 RepID=UPI0020BE25D1|nr:DUF4435 domain-containing protein [Pseudomonas syringae]MCL6306993.1 DUF4435 domain-containing protein [Pseudomonas syringae]
MERGKAAKFATSVFYEGFNDFDIYTEDTAPGYPKIIAAMFSRAMASTIMLDKVFPLGQRGDVISAAKKRLSSGNSRPAVYIVDGDLYLLTGERDDLPSNVVVLPRYCIENFMLDELAMVEVLDEEHCSLPREELRSQFDYQGWIDRSTRPLASLFRIFAAAHYLRSSVSTVARGYGAVCSGGDGEVDARKCAAIGRQILSELLAYHGEESVQAALTYVDSKTSSDKCFVTTYVSAKDFTLPLVILKMKSVAPIKVPHLSLKMRIARKCDVGPFADVIRKIGNVVKLPLSSTEGV